MSKTIQQLINANPWLLFGLLVAVNVGYFLTQYDSWSELTNPGAVGGLLVSVGSIFVQGLSRSVVNGK